MSADKQETIDLRALLQKLLHKWWVFGITVTLALACAVAYVKTTPKQWAVSGVMLMSEKKRNSFGATNDEFLKGSSYLSSGGELHDMISVLTSYANIRRTIDSLDFRIAYYEEKNFLRTEAYIYKPFVVRLDPSPAVVDVALQVTPGATPGTFRVKGKMKNARMFDPKTGKGIDGFVPLFAIDQEGRSGELFKSEYLSFTLTLDTAKGFVKGTSYFFTVFSPDGLATYYRNKTFVEEQGDESNIVTISSSGEVVQKEKDYVNMLMRTYIDGEQEKHNKKGERTIAFIDEALGESGKELAQAQGALQNAQAGGQMGDAGTQSSALNQELFRQQDQEGRIKSQLMSLTGLVGAMSVETGGTPTTIAASGIDAPSLNTLIDQFNKDVTDLRGKEITERIATAPTIALRRRVQTEREQIIQSAQSLVKQTQNELSGVQQRIGQLRGQLYALPGQDTRRRISLRNYELTEGIHNYLMEKSYEAQIAVNSDEVDKVVVDEARQAGFSPISPDKKTVFGGALLLGLLLPAAFILGRDFFNDRIVDIDELKRLSPIPILSTIPSSKRARITPDEPKSLLAESFRTARINLQYLNPGQKKQAIGFTSSSSGEGKTFCSINLSTVMAMSGKRTILIDADMRRPRVGEYLKLPDGPGLSTYLIGECTLDEVIRRSDIPGLDIITAGPLPPNPLELVEQPRLTELFEDLRARYDQVVVDASPMGLVSEFVVLMRHVDVSLYVVRQGYTRRGHLRLINEMYAEKKVQHLDLLLNDVKAGPGFGEGYGYYVN